MLALGELALDARKCVLRVRDAALDVRNALGGPHGLGLGGRGGLLRAAGARLGLAGGVRGTGRMAAGGVRRLLGARREALDGRKRVCG